MDHAGDGSLSLGRLRTRAQRHGLEILEAPGFEMLSKETQWALLADWYASVLSARERLDLNCDLRAHIRAVAGSAT